MLLDDDLMCFECFECFECVELVLTGLVIVHPPWQFVIVRVVAVETVIVRLLTTSGVGVGQYVVKAVTTFVVTGTKGAVGEEVDVEHDTVLVASSESVTVTIGTNADELGVTSIKEPAVEMQLAPLG
ncbi:hypothetical protein B0A55_12404 [Friedmanniomyces simplex]|uniref:Uncharacterized protein n=1 Tax=Friedmanniomyces simplex TaxID=329884 RepID=A0A4U0WKF4_9PEZI|nr:hypothetical protein B0A55_12404 [Friedmanniomyces simplex]